MNPDGRILKVINSSISKPLSYGSDKVNDINEDKNGKIWITTDDGLFCLSPDGKQLDRFDLHSMATRKRMFQFFFDSDENIWVGTDLGLNVFDTKKLVFTDISESPYFLAAMKSESTVTCIMKIHNGKLWFSTWWPNIGVYDTARKTKTYLYDGRDSISPDYFRVATAFYIDSKKELWMASGKGLYLLESGKGTISQSFFHEAGNPYSIIGNNVRAMMEDRDGNFWFGTSDGISIARPYQQWIHNLSINDIKTYPFGDKEIIYVVEIDSKHFIVSASNNDRFYLTDQNFFVKKYFKLPKSYSAIWAHYDDKPRHRIILSTGSGILLYDKKTDRLEIATDTIFKSWFQATSFQSVSDSILWVSRNRNTFGRYNFNTREFKQYDIRNMGEPERLINMEKDLNNNIWILPYGASPLRFDEKEEEFVQRFPMSDSGQSLLRDEVAFLKDLGDYFIIGYESKGISLYDKKTKTFKHFTQASGLGSNEVHYAIPAKDGTVWMATYNGLSRFDPACKEIRTLGYEEGILNNKSGYITQLSDGRIVAGTEKGLVYFYPGDVEKKEKPLPPPIFAEISVYGKKFFTDSLFETGKPLYVPYQKNYFSIEFISLKYNTGRPLDYAYMLEGLDKDWVSAGNRRFVSYSNMEGGKYNFRVKVKEPGGAWVEAKQSLPIFVETAFYKQRWFTALLVITVLGIIYIIYKQRIKSVRKKAQLLAQHEKDLLELEARALRAQMNPHFIFNSLNSIKSLINKNENDKATGYLTTFSKLIRTLFQNSDKREVSLHEELETCRLYVQLEKMRFGDKVHFVFNLDEQIDLKDIKVPALVLQPFIENAIWHGLVPKDAGGKVIVSVAQNNGVIECIIDDDGIGRELSAQYKAQYEATHHSKGIGLTQSRLELDKILNEREDSIRIIDKKDKNGDPAGTKVILTFKEN